MIESRAPAGYPRNGRKRKSLHPAAALWRAGWLVVISLLFVGSLRANPNKETTLLRFGYSSELFAEVNENDALAALKVWAQMVGTELGVAVDPVVPIYHSVDAIKEALSSAKIDGVSMTSVELWALRRMSPVNPTIFLGVTQGKVTLEYLLLARRDNPALRLAELRGQSLAVIGASPDHLANLWLETLLLEENLGTADAFWGTTTRSVKPSRILLPVFFRQVAACVVTREQYRTMSELNPQLGRELKILAQSSPMMFAVGGFRADLVSEGFDNVKANIGRVSATTSGRQMLGLFHVDQFTTRPISVLEETFALLDRHQRLLDASTGPATPLGEISPRNEGDPNR